MSTSDPRTLDEKLMDRARSNVDRAERDNARSILARRGLWPPPPSLDDAGAITTLMRTASVPSMPGCAGGFHYGRVNIGRGGRAMPARTAGLDADGRRHLG